MERASTRSHLVLAVPEERNGRYGDRLRGAQAQQRKQSIEDVIATLTIWLRFWLDMAAPAVPALVPVTPAAPAGNEAAWPGYVVADPGGGTGVCVDMMGSRGGREGVLSLSIHAVFLSFFHSSRGLFLRVTSRAIAHASLPRE